MRTFAGLFCLLLLAGAAVAQAPRPPIDKLKNLTDVNITSVSDNQVLTYDSAQGKWKNAAAGAGSGTVTNFSAGTLSPIFTTGVTNPTTTPNLTFTLSNAGAHSFLGNNTGSTGAPSYVQPAFSDLSGTATLSQIGASTVGGNLLTLTNPSAITFLRVNADNTVTAQTAANFKTSLSLNNVTNDAQIKASDFPASSVDAEIMLFAGTTGKSAKRATGTGVVNVSSGVYQTPLSNTTVGTNFLTLTNPSAITFPRINADNSVSALSQSAFKTALSLTASDVGLGSVTNDAQTKASIVPNTAPTSGQILIGNAGNTAYAPQTLSGSGATFTLSNAGLLTISAIANASLPATLSSKTFDDTNTYTAKDGSFTLENTTTTTKKAVFDLSNIGAATTRTVNIPNANSTTIQADTGAANNFLTAVSAQGVISKARPTISNLADLTGTSKLIGSNATTAPVTEITLGSGLSMTGSTLNVTSGGGNVSNSGTPTTDQLPIWTDATHIKGVTGLTGGSLGQVLKKNSATDYDWGWGSVTAGAAGSDTQIQFNDGGTNLGADADLTWDKTNNILTSGGDIHASATGSSTTTPRVVGITNLAAGNAARFQFGDAANTLQGSFGGRLMLVSYWGISAWGQTQQASIGFETGSVNDACFTINGATNTPILELRAAAGGQTTPLTKWINNVPLEKARMNGSATQLSMSSDGMFAWNSTTDFSAGSIDTALARNAAGIVEINNGTAGQYRDLQARTLLAGGGTYTTPALSLFASNVGWFSAGGGDVQLSIAANPIMMFYNSPPMLRIGANGFLQWSSNNNPSQGAGDVALYRNAAGILEVNSSTAGTFRDILARGLRSNAVTFANKIASPIEGTLQAFTDSSTTTQGDTITGGGSGHVVGYYNGTNWIVTSGSGGAGGGNVSNSGTPTTGQYARWTDATHIEGVATSTVKTDLSLNNVTNDAQTKASIVPNTVPTDGQILVGKTASNAYTAQTVSGSGATISLDNSGVLSISAIANTSLSNSAITIAGTSTSLGGSITLDSITGVSSNGVVKRTGANTYTNLTDTTVGDNLLTLTNPSAIRFLKINADNTVTAEAAATHLTSLGGTTAGLNLFDYVNGTGNEQILGITAAGAITEYQAPGSAGQIVGVSATQTLTNKRVNPRTNAAASNTNWTPQSDSYDEEILTGLTGDCTINAPSGTPVQGQKLILRITSNASPHNLSFNGTYTAIGVTIPTSIAASKTLYVGCIYNATLTRWDVVAVAVQA